MSIELILLAVNINFVAFSDPSRRHRRPGFALFVLTVAPRKPHRAAISCLFPQPRLDRGGRHQLMKADGIYQAIVLLPLLGAIRRRASSLAGARARIPAAACRPARDMRDHGRMRRAAPEPHGPVGHDDPMQPASRRGGSRLAEVITTSLLMVAPACVLDRLSMGLPGEARSRCLTITSGDLKSTGAAHRPAHRRHAGRGHDRLGARSHSFDRYMAEDPYRPRFFAYMSLFTFAKSGAGDRRQPRPDVLRLGGRRLAAIC
jgi:hypothetical protein